MAGGGQQQTSTTTAEPWDKTVPYLEQIMKGAQGAFNSGVGFQPYAGNTVVGQSPQTQAALSGIESTATAGDPLQSANQQNIQNVLGSGGMSDWQRQALGQTYQTATGNNNIGTEGDWRGLLGYAGQQGNAQSNLGGMASGANLMGSPAFLEQLDRQSGKLRDDINRGVSGIGRYGSAAQGNVVGEQVGNFRNNAIANNYQNELQAMLSANSQIGAERQNAISNQGSILGNIGNVQGTNIANQVGAGSQINQAGNQAGQLAGTYGALAPTISANAYAPYQQLAGVGAQNEDLTTRQYQDALSRWQASQQQPWNMLSAYQGILGGLGGMGSSAQSSVTAPTNYAAPIGGALGGAQLGSMFGPWGTAIGGGLGGLLGLL